MCRDDVETESLCLAFEECFNTSDRQHDRRLPNRAFLNLKNVNLDLSDLNIEEIEEHVFQFHNNTQIDLGATTSKNWTRVFSKLV